MNDPHAIARIEERLIALAARVASIESLIRWLGLAVGAALVGAVLNLVLK
jgi:hypothetical protein